MDLDKEQDSGSKGRRCCSALLGSSSRSTFLAVQVVVVNMGGIDLKAWEAVGSKWLPNLHGLMGAPLPLILPKADSAPGYQVNLVMRVTPSKKSMQKRREEKKLAPVPPPEHYCATMEALEANHFPMPVVNGDDGSITCPEGWVATQPAGQLASAQSSGQPQHDLLALDCEMVTTEEGLELARATVVDRHGKPLLDMYCRPERPVLDYNTRYSGITAEHLEGCSTRLADVQQALLRLVASESILIGHSLENDLTALRLIHPRIVDTSLIYPHPKGEGYKQALRVLAERFLKRKIQSGTHDSLDDARATMDLALLKFKHGPTWGTPDDPENAKDHVVDLLGSVGRTSCLVDRPEILRRLTTGAASAIPVQSDAEALDRVATEARKEGGAHFLWTSLNSFVEQQDQRWMHGSHSRPLQETSSMLFDPTFDFERDKDMKKAATELDAALGRLHEELPPNTLLVVVTSQGDTCRSRKATELRMKRMNSSSREELDLPPWKQEDEERFATLCTRVRTACLFATVT